jgi:hypothetical protein
MSIRWISVRFAVALLVALCPDAAAGLDAGWTPDASTAARGVLVVSTADGVSPMAQALALEVYRDVYLRPPAVDDATARVLAGGFPHYDAPASVTEMAQRRLLITAADSGLASRTQLTSLAARLGAALVVAVEGTSIGPSARVLRPGADAFETAEMHCAIERTSTGRPLYLWYAPGGVHDTLRTFLPAAPPPRLLAAPFEALDAPPPTEEAQTRHAWPWLWGLVGCGALVAVLVVLQIRRRSRSRDRRAPP